MDDTAYKSQNQRMTVPNSDLQKVTGRTPIKPWSIQTNLQYHRNIVKPRRQRNGPPHHSQDKYLPLNKAPKNGTSFEVIDCRTSNRMAKGLCIPKDMRLTDTNKAVTPLQQDVCKVLIGHHAKSHDRNATNLDRLRKGEHTLDQYQHIQCICYKPIHNPARFKAGQPTLQLW